MASSPAAVPLDPATAERIARIALRPGATMTVGPRVLAGLLARIDELQAELDRHQAHDLEDARLRAHALWAQRERAV